MLKNHKVGIVGSKNVGKTTLAHLLVGYLKSLGTNTSLVHEVAKHCPLPINENTSIEASLWIFGNQIANEMILSNKAITICDRTVVDVYPFAKVSNPNLTKDLLLLKKNILQYLLIRPYDVLFYIPVQSNIGENNTYQKKIDTAFSQMFESFPAEVVTIHENDSNSRLEEVVQWLKFSKLIDN